MPSDDDLITASERGLYCAAGGFYIDPWLPVEQAVITHAHGDHLRTGGGDRQLRTLPATVDPDEWGGRGRPTRPSGSDRKVASYRPGMGLASGRRECDVPKMTGSLRRPRIALVGAGPTAIYCLQALLARQRIASDITVFERQRRAGQGTPYSPYWSDPILLANIASVEIPPLPQGLVEWLLSETDARLAGFGVDREAIDERAFYPRLVLGEYLAAQLSTLVKRGRSSGSAIEVRTHTEVTDVVIVEDGIRVKVTDGRQAEATFLFDYVILATGHQWPADPEIRPGYFTSPWPAAALARIRNRAVGIRGASLTAIDAAVALAVQHGSFIEADTEGLTYQADPETEDFSITLFSRKGILPEADFYHPIPYEPLVLCNLETIQPLIVDCESDGLLDAAFALFLQELALVDGAYLNSLRSSTPELTPETFHLAYFDERTHVDPFDWARRNLERATVNLQVKFTEPWRYAILRMHEVFGALARYLGDHDFMRFSESLKPVFVDNYATVPHESIRRLLALHVAGKLSMARLSDDARIDTHSSGEGATLRVGARSIHFPVFIEATGQKVLGAKDFPFPSLRRQGVIQDRPREPGSGARRGIAIDGDYHPISAFESSDRLFCLSLPFVLGEHPFAQGLTGSAEMAEVVADAIENSEAGEKAVQHTVDAVLEPSTTIEWRASAHGGTHRHDPEPTNRLTSVEMAASRHIVSIRPER